MIITGQICLGSIEPANHTGSYTTVSKEKVDTEIATSQVADIVTIDIINIISRTTITTGVQLLRLTSKRMAIILPQGQDIWILQLFS
jgi:hypothetical protein